MITFERDPASYRHWRLESQGEIATLLLDVDEDGGIAPGYKLKLNSYDLGVDIELEDALQRIRFEHPEVKAVVLTSAKPRTFSSGANIYMLGLASHAAKVNFCKFTNETRNGIEDASRSSGLKFLAALNGNSAGGGYELALACDEIVMIDDGSSAVSLPEVPLLGVLPGTGGLTRLIDKRKMRRDLADVFCTMAEGVRAERAREWKLIDDAAMPQQFEALVSRRARALAQASDRPGGAGVSLTPLGRQIDAGGYRYETLDVRLAPERRQASLLIQGPRRRDVLEKPEEILAAGASWWPLKLARELNDAILLLRHNEPSLGTWVLRTSGDIELMLAVDQSLAGNLEHWLVRETVNFLRRVLRRLDISSRSLFALIEPGSCFAGSLFELALAADRSYMLDGGDPAPAIALSPMNFGPCSMNSGMTRLENRFAGEAGPVLAARVETGKPLPPRAARELGLVTFTPDELDWEEEVRIAMEERASLSPDALTGMEACLRFCGPENLDTRIFGRLSAWQNWIFQRPNAVGDQGALKVYGSGAKARFDWDRV